MPIHPKNLLDHHQPGNRLALRFRNISVQLKTVLRLQLHPFAHLDSLLFRLFPATVPGLFWMQHSMFPGKKSYQSFSLQRKWLLQRARQRPDHRRDKDQADQRQELGVEQEQPELPPGTPIFSDAEAQDRHEDVETIPDRREGPGRLLIHFLHVFNIAKDDGPSENK